MNQIFLNFPKDEICKCGANDWAFATNRYVCMKCHKEYYIHFKYDMMGNNVIKFDDFVFIIRTGWEKENLISISTESTELIDDINLKYFNEVTIEKCFSKNIRLSYYNTNYNKCEKLVDKKKLVDYLIKTKQYEEQ